MTFQLLNFIQQNFPDFNPEKEQDLIRAEKILKAEQKMNSGISNQNIEDFINFYKTYGNRFQKFLKDKRFTNFFLSENHHFHRYSFYFNDDDQRKLREFGDIFENEIKVLINKNINKNFSNIEYLISTFRPAINLHNEEFLNNYFSERLKIIGNNLQNGNHKSFDAEYSFAFNPNFYRCLSVLNAEIFEKDILKISRFGETESRNKKQNIATGKILDAISNFKSTNPEIKQYLQNRKIVGKLLRKDEETLYSKTEERLQKNWVEKQDSWKDVFLAVFFMMIFVGIFVLIYLYLPIYVFAFEFLMTGILFFAFAGAPNNWGVAEYDTSEYTFIRHFKKFSLSLYIIFRYILFVLILGNILIGILAFFAYITI